MTPKKIIISIFLILVLVGGFVAGLFLIRQRQDIREEAAVPGGDAEVSILPKSGTFDPGDSFPVSIYLNTANIAINGVSVRLFYPFSGSTPEIRASNIQINPTLTSSGDWQCTTRDVSEGDNIVNIDIGCSIIAAEGFKTNSDTLLATLDLSIERAPQANPVEIKFDASKSKVTQLTNGEDILLIPQSSAAYTISGGGVQPTATPTPTGTAGPTATPQPGVTVTSTPTPTVRPTSTPTTAPSVTATPTLMDSGVSYPTLIGIGFALLIVIGSVALAL
ncbi:hypothetical protein JXA63_03330 [Candidatus Woesebacteria bacterium]|nr:hypothetical protein [Candidatus Woesebacteria bacterium]